ncbi:hypothetical protein DSL72_007435 [Monilinia vaccinii-corymbosi]|uniref:Uncharacterized protein n=1 Tax=Monilinia vaccinii-corymbosi TaxID=61207 RepID=A0A8A3PN03_9HELO|nr:hypothetical protein DSL72_007435 [Monilinia vaccinii-corymbosi]
MADQLIERNPLGNAANPSVNGPNNDSMPHATASRRCRWKYHTTFEANLRRYNKHWLGQLDLAIAKEESDDAPVDVPSSHPQECKPVQSETIMAAGVNSDKRKAPRTPLPSAPLPSAPLPSAHLPSAPLPSAHLPSAHLPSTPGLEGFEWLKRRAYQNRPLYRHSGRFRAIRGWHIFRLLQRRKIRNISPQKILRMARRLARKSSSKLSPVEYHDILDTGINQEERYLEQTGFKIPLIRDSTRLGSGEQECINSLRDQKQYLRDLLVELSHRKRMQKSMISATRCARERRVYIDQMKWENDGKLCKDATSNHRMSAVPWYMAYEFRKTRKYLGTGLSNGVGAGDGLERNRTSFPDDPLGEKSTLRMELFADSTSNPEYRKKTGYGSVNSIESSMFNIVPIRLLPLREDISQEHESAESVEDDINEDDTDEDDPDEEKEAPMVSEGPHAKLRRLY